MADHVLLTADINNSEEVIALAFEYGIGLELMEFAYPDVLDGNWRQLLATYKGLLRNLPGKLTIHGPFMDMVSGSPDEQINQVCMERYRHSIHIAAELGAELVNLHANFIGSLHNPAYREGWHKRNVPFWMTLAEYAAERGVIIALENMWEFEPFIIRDLLRDVDHPNLKACLDVGHATVFGDVDFTLQTWIETMKPWLVHTHLNNNNGVMDEHYGFDWEHGALDYDEILPLFRAMETPPNFVLEMWHPQDMRDSLYYFQLEKFPINQQD
ncbi:MAG: sugar phosphate isomerase/epimerase [Phototrophicales bacterium]|nr:MAG: hypothetical protein CUN56_00335 [Phototrophicales bacterium]RMG71129.1 MAG: sugar phosphate isomerase/epimerase [Chloroflexota bacterium]